MAGERRTRAEKAGAQLHRQEHLTYSFRAGQGIQQNLGATTGVKAGSTPAKVTSPKAKPIITDLFAYDVRLIYQDLLKTVIITGIILAAVVGIKFGLH